jgi:hypothetical protein
MTYGFEQTANEVHDYLVALQAERTFTADPAYLAFLDDEIEATSSAYVGAAVTEIATLRAELFGPQVG